MTADIVNLRQVRKRRARAADERRAEENRAKFGRTKISRAQEDAEKSRTIKTLDGAKREPSDPETTL